MMAWATSPGRATGALSFSMLKKAEGAVQKKRRHKYVAAITELTAALTGCDTVNRKQWASALGKLQHTAPLVRGMQSLLSTPYSVLRTL